MRIRAVAGRRRRRGRRVHRQAVDRQAERDEPVLGVAKLSYQRQLQQVLRRGSAEYQVRAGLAGRLRGYGNGRAGAAGIGDRECGRWRLGRQQRGFGVDIGRCDPAIQQVGAGTADQQVAAVAADDGVVADAAADLVVPRATHQQVVAAQALDDLGNRRVDVGWSAPHAVGTRRDDHIELVRAAIDSVVPARRMDHVGPEAAVDQVLAGRATGDRVAKNGLGRGSGRAVGIIGLLGDDIDADAGTVRRSAVDRVGPVAAGDLRGAVAGLDQVVAAAGGDRIVARLAAGAPDDRFVDRGTAHLRQRLGDIQGVIARPQRGVQPGDVLEFLAGAVVGGDEDIARRLL